MAIGCDFGCKELIDWSSLPLQTLVEWSPARSSTLPAVKVDNMWFLWNQKTSDAELATELKNTEYKQSMRFCILFLVVLMRFICHLQISVTQKSRVLWNNATILSCNINIKFLWIGDSWNLQSKGKPHESKANSIKSIAAIRNLPYPVDYRFMFTLKTSKFCDPNNSSR